MNPEETELPEAAASLTVEDFRYLQEHGMIPDHIQEDIDSSNAQGGVVRALTKPKKTKRRQVKHQWPEVGTVLEADYFGQHYEAEVVTAPRYKSGKAVRILTGPAAGQVYRSLSGAMLKATEKQRQDEGLGKKGVANGWTFWSVKRQPN